MAEERADGPDNADSQRTDNRIRSDNGKTQRDTHKDGGNDKTATEDRIVAADAVGRRKTAKNIRR